MSTSNRDLPPDPPYSPIPGIKSIIIGPPGTGKTYALRTLEALQDHVQSLAIFTDPNYSSGLFPSMEYTYIRPTVGSIDDLKFVADKTHTLPMDTLQKIDIGRAKYTSFMDVLNQLADYHPMSGKPFGNFAKWGTDKCLIMDNLTGLSRMARGWTAGGKPNPTQPEWGSMMYLLEQLLTLLATGTWAHVILIAHIEQERDEISGAMKNMMATLGRKLAPKIPTDFNDVILARKEGDKFFWDTMNTNTDIKSMHLPFKDNLPPTFVSLFDSWQKRGGLFLPGSPDEVSK
jgi:hypothetical protein